MGNRLDHIPAMYTEIFLFNCNKIINNKEKCPNIICEPINICILHCLPSKLRIVLIIKLKNRFSSAYLFIQAVQNGRSQKLSFKISNVLGV